MPRRLHLPDSASVAQPSADGRMYAPSAARNREHIADLLADYVPETGKVLELAAGTGEHSVHMAARFPNLVWQPSDIDPDRLNSIAAHGAASKLPNLQAPITIDATTAGWGAQHSGQDVIVLVNLLHLISTPEAKTLLTEVAQALKPGGVFALYGPFLRDGEPTSDGDQQFDAALRAQDPQIGYKDDFDVIDWLQGNWLELAEVVEMPANNLSFIARR